MEGPEGCLCSKKEHQGKFIVITGGPGAGKTAILEMIKKSFCSHVKVLPEAASILFKGGFWREEKIFYKKSAQKLIYLIQKELENIVMFEKNSALALCDRGGLDGLAYWPEEELSFWKTIESDKKKELSFYSKIIHLKTPGFSKGYNLENPLRIESNREALNIDKKLLKIWEDHPNRVVIESTEDFSEKANQALKEIYKELPSCCQRR